MSAVDDNSSLQQSSENSTCQVEAQTSQQEGQSRREKLGGMEFFRRILGSPRFVVAPMVDQSELPWRLLSRFYGAHLCYTPMIHSAVFLRDKTYRDSVFTTTPPLEPHSDPNTLVDRPLIVQLCGNDPEIILGAAKLLQDRCDAIDINLGCPQGIARRGRYGAFLQDEWELLEKIVGTLHSKLDVPVTCKIRIHKDRQRTIEYAKMLERSGCQMLTVHGRHREQKGPRTGLADWSIIKEIKQALTIPVIANGNIIYGSDVEHCIQQTGVDGVMSSEGNLHNPALFTGTFPLVWEVTDKYLDLVEQYPVQLSMVRGHLFRLWHKSINTYPDIRDQLAGAHTLEEMRKVAADFAAALQQDAKDVHNTADDMPDESKWPSVASCDPSFTFPSVPDWRCQPKLRNHDKDKKILSDAPALSKRAAEEYELKVKAKKVKLKQPKVQRYEKCATCGNPKGTKCQHARCRLCCKTYAATNALDCVGHKLFFQKRAQTQSSMAAS